MNLTSFKNQIWDLLRGVSDDMETIFQPITQNYGLTMIQVRILLELNMNGAQSIGALGKTIGIAGGNMSAMCKKLQQLGFVTRIRDDRDERIVKVTLSGQGEDTIHEVDELLIQRYSQCLAGENEEDLDNIIEGLKKLRILLQRLKHTQEPPAEKGVSLYG